MIDFPRTPEEARQRVIELMNKIIQVDEAFARLLVGHKFNVPNSIMDAEGKDEVQIEVTKKDDKWVTSTLGVVNGVLKALGCGRIQVVCQTGDNGEITSVTECLPRVRRQTNDQCYRQNGGRDESRQKRVRAAGREEGP